MRRPPWPAVLSAPAWGLARLERAAVLLSRASPLQLGVLMLGFMALEATLCVFMCVWNETVHYEYHMVTTRGVSYRDSWEVQTDTLQDVWSRWAARGDRNPAIGISMGVGFATLAGIIAAMAMFWTRVHRHGPLRLSLRRTQAAVLASAGFVVLCTSIVFTAFVQFHQWRIVHGIRYGGGLEEGQVAVFGIQLSILLLLYIFGRAAQAASDTTFSPNLPPVCEGCGYDLTHRPESGLCPECGASVQNSLEPGLLRTPSAFDRLGSWGAWVSTSLDALMTPLGFRQGLAMRNSPRRDASFRVRHHAVIGVGAAVWVCMLISVDDHPPRGLEFYFFIVAAGLAATIGGWVIFHGLLSLVSVVWHLQRTLPDMQWGLRAANYDSVFLWVFCLFDGTMITSFFIFDDWLGDLLGHWTSVHGFSGPTAPLVMPAANITLIAFWMLRLYRAGPAVRWANY